MAPASCIGIGHVDIAVEGQTIGQEDVLCSGGREGDCYLVMGADSPRDRLPV